MADEEEVNQWSAEAEALHLMVKAWRAREFLEQHAKELLSDNPCRECIVIVQAVLFRQGKDLDTLACDDAQKARVKIDDAIEQVKRVTGLVIR